MDELGDGLAASRMLTSSYAPPSSTPPPPRPAVTAVGRAMSRTHLGAQLRAFVLLLLPRADRAHQVVEGHRQLTYPNVGTRRRIETGEGLRRIAASILLPLRASACRVWLLSAPLPALGAAAARLEELRHHLVLGRVLSLGEVATEGAAERVRVALERLGRPQPRRRLVDAGAHARDALLGRPAEPRVLVGGGHTRTRWVRRHARQSLDASSVPPPPKGTSLPPAASEAPAPARAAPRRPLPCRARLPNQSRSGLKVAPSGSISERVKDEPYVLGVYTASNARSAAASCDPHTHETARRRSCTRNGLIRAAQTRRTAAVHTWHHLRARVAFQARSCGSWRPLRGFACLLTLRGLSGGGDGAADGALRERERQHAAHALALRGQLGRDVLRKLAQTRIAAHARAANERVESGPGHIRLPRSIDACAHVRVDARVRAWVRAWVRAFMCVRVHACLRSCGRSRRSHMHV
eukprot:5448533-Pleurochrysis_carterae.AAC.7